MKNKELYRPFEGRDRGGHVSVKKVRFSNCDVMLSGCLREVPYTRTIGLYNGDGILISQG